MPSFTVPFEVPIADPDPAGPIRRFVRIRIPVRVEVTPGHFIKMPPFVLDTGATYTIMIATLARTRGIPVPTATSRLSAATAAGSRSGLVHDGEIRVRFWHLPGHAFRLYCVFNEDVPPSVPPLFGLSDFFDVFRVTVDGTPTPDSVFGTVRVETLPGRP